jgi:MFS family permease
MGSESLRAVSGSRMIRLSLCFRSQIAPKLPAPSRFPGIYSANLFGQSFGALVALRFLLGIFEAGLVPGAVYLISMYYKRYELQWRLSVFFCASILAGAFGGLFAYALTHMDGIGGYSGKCLLPSFT